MYACTGFLQSYRYDTGLYLPFRLKRWVLLASLPLEGPSGLISFLVMVRLNPAAPERRVARCAAHCTKLERGSSYLFNFWAGYCLYCALKQLVVCSTTLASRVH